MCISLSGTLIHLTFRLDHQSTVPHVDQPYLFLTPAMESSPEMTENSLFKTESALFIIGAAQTERRLKITKALRLKAYCLTLT